MGTFYIRADGTAVKAAATGPASDATACMSVATHNAATFAAGDEILLSSQGGALGRINIPSSGSEGSPIVYGKVPGESPAVTVADYVLYASAKTDVTVQDLALSNTAGGGTCVLLAGACQRITIQRCAIDAAAYGVQFSGAAADCTIDACTFTRCTTNVIYAYGASGTGLTVTGNTFPTGAGGIRLTSQAVTTITGNTFGTTVTPAILNTTQAAGASVFSDNTFTGSTTTDAYTISIASCTNGTITMAGNTITGGTQSKVYISASTATTTISDLTVASNGDLGVVITNSSNVTLSGSSLNCSVSMIAGSHHCTITGNDIYGMASDGIVLNDASHTNTVTFNKVHDGGVASGTAAGDGITSHGGDYNNTVAYNLIYNMTGTGLAFVQTSHGWAYNNVIYNCGNPTGEGAVTQVRAGVYLELTGNNATTGASWTVKNNIVYGNGPRQFFVSAAAKDLVDCDYNCYYGEVDANKFATLDSGSTDITWETYHASYEPNSIHADPLFTDAAAATFTLQTASPAIDAGVAVASLSRDYAGVPVPQGLLPDIGAHEWYTTAAAIVAASADIVPGRTVAGVTGTATVSLVRGGTRHPDGDGYAISNPTEVHWGTA